MRRWAVLAAIVAIGVFVGAQAATGATTRTLSWDAAALIAYDSDEAPQFTTHFNAQTCDDATTDPADSESKGALLQFRGGMLFPIQLTQGATVTRLRLFAVDQDNNADVSVYLVRKKLQTGVPKDAGYNVMALAKSNGNVMTNVRAFTDTTITTPVADTVNFTYYLELVSCNITVEPIGIQLTMTS
jgi:hypothetical protein